MQTIRVKPWGEGQGDFVLINAEDFDPASHVMVEPATPDEAEAVKPAKARRAPKSDSVEG